MWKLISQWRSSKRDSRNGRVRRQATRKKRVRCRLNVEQLEDRVCPTSLSFFDEFDGFSPDFTGAALDSAKWNTAHATSGQRWCSSSFSISPGSGAWQDVAVVPCLGRLQAPLFGDISLGGGVAAFGSGLQQAFPYIWSGPPSRSSPFPSSGDFALEIRMKYDSITPHGTGFFVNYWLNTDPVGTNAPEGQRVFQVWADTALGGCPRTFLPGTAFSRCAGDAPVDYLAFHTYRLEYRGGNYTVFIDGTSALGPTPSALRPTAMWLGTPVFAFGADWTDFRVDYIRVETLNTPPTANAGGPYTVAEGGATTLTGTGAGGSPLTYAWDLDNNGTFETPGQSVTFSAAGRDGPSSQTVVLRVCDNQGACATSTGTVNISNVAPTATLSNTGAVDEGSTGAVIFSAQSDPSPADVAAGFRYAYDFNNDGTFEVVDSTAASATVPASYLADGPGTRTVRARIIDRDGGFTDLTTDITVRNVAPTATFNVPASVNEGRAFTLSLTSPSDPSSADTAAGFTYAFDPGDGSGYLPFSQSNSISFPTNDNGTRTVKGKIRDRDGGVTEYVGSVTVNNVAPIASLSNSSGGSVFEGQGVVVNFTLPSDQSPADTGAGFRYAYDFNNDGTFDLGDGTYAGSRPSFFSDGGSGANVPASFLDGPGGLTVRARIIDKDDGFTDYATSFTINNVRPTATFANGGSVIQGLTGRVSFSGQADPSPVDVAAGFRYAYDFNNDGTFEIGNGAYAGSSTSSLVTVPASFLTPGLRTVQGRILDKDGGFTDYTTTITVITPLQATTNLAAQVTAALLPPSIRTALLAVLSQAADALERDNRTAARNLLRAFHNQVQARRLQIGTALADSFLSASPLILDALAAR